MKKFFAVAALAATFCLMSFAVDTTVKGYIMDTKCSTNPAMKGNKTCAQSCAKGGSPAVLVADDGDKVYQISNQAAVAKVLGSHVTVKGAVTGDSIAVTTAKASPAPKAAAK